MDIIQYLENNEFRLDGALPRAVPSVEDIALSMRRHLLQDSPNEETTVQNLNSVLSKENNVYQSHFSSDLRAKGGGVAKSTDESKSAGSDLSEWHESSGFRSHFKSQFYEELRNKYPQAFKKRSSDITKVNDTISRPSTPAKLIASSISDISGRSRPSTPLKCNSSSSSDTAGLTRAASLLLQSSRNRLNSSYTSDSESVQANEEDSGKKHSLSERLKENSLKMNSLLRHPSFTRFKSEQKGQQGTKDNTPASGRPNGVRDRLSSSPDSPHDSAIEAGDSASVQSTKSIDGVMYISAARSGHSPVAYCENDSEKKGYHTCESDDCDSGIGKYEGKENRLTIPESRLVNESSTSSQSNARAVLKMLHKKKEQTSSSPSLLHAQKSSRPVKADHNITPVKYNRENEAVRQKKPAAANDGYVEGQKRVEILPDTPIRNENIVTSDGSQANSNSPLQTLSPFPHSLPRSPSRTSLKSNCSAISQKSTQSNASNRSVRFEEPINEKPQSVRVKPRPASAMARSEPYYSLNGNVSKKSRSTVAAGQLANDLQSQVKPVRRSRTPDPTSLTHATPTNGLDTYGLHGQRQSFEGYHQTTKAVSNTVQTRPKSAADRARKKNFAPIPPPPEYISQSSWQKRPQSAGPSFSSQQLQQQPQTTQTEFPSNNPCVVRSNVDDEITEIYQQRSFASDVDHFSELSDSRTSLSSRSSISDKFQNIGRVTKQKFSKMRRALSLERLDNDMERREPSNPTRRGLKKSPSLRSLTNLFGGKGKGKKLDYDKSFYSLNGKGSRPGSAMSDIIPSSRRSRYSSPSPRYSSASDIELPSHLRKVGRLLQINSDGTQVIELVRPPSGPFGFYIAKGKDTLRKSIFVSRLSDGYADKIFTGLLSVGDEILEINYQHVQGLALDDVYELMADQPILVLKILPFVARKEWESYHQ